MYINRRSIQQKTGIPIYSIGRFGTYAPSRGNISIMKMGHSNSNNKDNIVTLRAERVKTQSLLLQHHGCYSERQMDTVLTVFALTIKCNPNNYVIIVTFEREKRTVFQ